jgi:hypothetical protein
MNSRLVSLSLLLLGGAACFGAARHVPGPAPFPPEEAAARGRALVEDLLSRQPEPFTNSGTIVIRRGRETREIPVLFSAVTGPEQWVDTFGSRIDGRSERLVIVHRNNQLNRYTFTVDGRDRELSGGETMAPFAGSDFWVADLGLEFLHWREQRVLRNDVRRGQACHVLESVNPDPAPGGYAKVVAWIDIDTGGIINAEAFDSRNRLLKQFGANEFKKVNGRWEVQEIEMINRAARTQTTIRFRFTSHG